MYSAMLVGTGAILLIYCMYVIRKMIPIIEWRYLKRYWRVIFFLALLTFGGYAMYLRKILLYPEPISLLSAALFFWPVFLMIAVRASYQLVDWLKVSETSINVGRHTLESDQNSVDKLRNALELKNEEMDKLLGELYALRDIRGKSGSENKRMNKILNELKAELDKNRNAVK